MSGVVNNLKMLQHIGFSCHSQYLSKWFTWHCVVFIAKVLKCNVCRGCCRRRCCCCNRRCCSMPDIENLFVFVWVANSVQVAQCEIFSLGDLMRNWPTIKTKNDVICICLSHSAFLCYKLILTINCFSSDARVTFSNWIFMFAFKAILICIFFFKWSSS